MTLRLNGSTSGYTEIDAPAAAGNNTLVLPTGNGSADQVVATNGSGTLSFVDRGRMVLETAKASTSGTSVDFTGIPSWVKRVTVMFSGVSTNGTSPYLVQLGSSSGIEVTGYSSAVGSFNYTTGLGVCRNLVAASSQTGISTICLLEGNTWVSSGCVGADGGNGQESHTGSKSLSGTLDRIRVTTVNGTDTFDAGSINILYEG